MIPFLLTTWMMLLGPWYAEVPIEGVTAENESTLRATLIRHFATMTDRSGRHPFALEVEVIGDRARLLVMCDADLRLTHVEEALRGTSFRVEPEAWRLFGKLSLEWSETAAMKPEAITALRQTLENLGQVEIARVDGEKGYAADSPTYHAHIVFAKGQAVAARRVLAAFVVHDLPRPDILWENYPHMNSRIECGARRLTAISRK